MTHASRGHDCGFCDRRVYGNGGQVAHGRMHVRRGHAVEVVKHYATYPPVRSRFFVAPDEVPKWVADGFAVEAAS
jgi:hypothetical protein